jgi:hypothetical protein
MTKQSLTRVFGLIGGVYLAGLPTYYALFTVGDAGSGARSARDLGWELFAVWVLTALVVGYSTLLKDSELFSILRPARRRLSSARQYDAVNSVVALLLDDPRFALLRAFSPRVFVCDDRKKPTELLPFEIDHPADWQRFRVGYGAVGAAFDANRDDVLVFSGSTLERQNGSLTAEQLIRYGSLKLVAAIVLRGLDERPIGTLSASPENASGFGPSRVNQMSLLASELGILIEVLA